MKQARAAYDFSSRTVTVRGKAYKVEDVYLDSLSDWALVGLGTRLSQSSDPDALMAKAIDGSAFDPPAARLSRAEKQRCVIATILAEKAAQIEFENVPGMPIPARKALIAKLIGEKTSIVNAIPEGDVSDLCKRDDVKARYSKMFGPARDKAKLPPIEDAIKQVMT